MEGYQFFDKVCLGYQGGHCLPHHKLLGIYLSHELTELEADGVLGLAPSDQGSTSKLFVEELYNAGVIGQKMFSMSFGQSA